MGIEKTSSVCSHVGPSLLRKRKKDMAEFEKEIFRYQLKEYKKMRGFSEHIPFVREEHELDFRFVDLGYDCENPKELARKINDILLRVEKAYSKKLVHQQFLKRIPKILSFLLQHHHEDAPLEEQASHAAYYITTGISLHDLYRFIKSQRLTIQYEVENFPHLDKVILQEERLESAVDHQFANFKNSFENTKSLLLSLNIWNV